MTQPATQKRSGPFRAGLLGCFGVGVAMLIVIFVVAVIVASGTDTSGVVPAVPPVASSDAPTPTTLELKYTVAQQEAIELARSYLETGAFSRKGLIRQLTSKYGEGFSKADAIFAVDQVSPNWKAEAVESARSYLETGEFSRSGLINQLTSSYGEGFTRTEAEYAVKKVGP